MRKSSYDPNREGIGHRGAPSYEVGEVAEDGFRLTAGGPPLQDLRTSQGKLTTFHGNFQTKTKAIYTQYAMCIHILPYM